MSDAAVEHADESVASPGGDSYAELGAISDAYRRLISVAAPYVTFISKPGFRSEVVNTDRNGFRVTHHPGGALDSESWSPAEAAGIVLGGSFVFGNGASSDRTTLVSRLSLLTGRPFLNLGIMGGNSLQECIAALPFVQSCATVLVCSGYNNLFANLQSVGGNELFGPFFFEENYEAIAAVAIAVLAEEIDQPLRKVRLGGLLREAARRVHRRVAGRRRGGFSWEEYWFGSFGAMYERWERSNEEIIGRAVSLQLRDLRNLVALAPAGTRVVFAAQPYAAASRKAWTLEEQSILGAASLRDEWRVSWMSLRGALGAAWPGYVSRLRDGCVQQGVPFVDLNDTDLEGWCYVDDNHMTDTGYDQIATALAPVVA